MLNGSVLLLFEHFERNNLNPYKQRQKWPYDYDIPATFHARLVSATTSLNVKIRLKLYESGDLLISFSDILPSWEKLETLVSKQVFWLDWVLASLKSSLTAATLWLFGK